MATQREIAELIISIEAQTGELKKQIGGVSSTITKFGKKHESIFKGLRQNWLLYTAGITAAAFAIKRFVAPFTAFEHKMREVNTLTNLSTKGFKDLQKTVLDMTRRVPQSARELADALYDIVSAGVDVADTNIVLEQSAKAAVAGVTSTKVAVNAGLAVINAYGKEIGELDNVYDVLFQTVKEGVITFEGIAGSIGTVLPVASAANVEIEAIAGSIATLTKQGIAAQKATTFLRSGILALTAPTVEAKKTMTAMGITWNGWLPTLRQIRDLGLDLEGMRKIIPDIRAGQAIIALTQNLDDLEEVMGEIGDASGSMQTAFDIMQESPVNQMKFLSNAIDEIKIAITTAFAPEVIVLIQKATSALTTFADALIYFRAAKQIKEVDRSIKEMTGGVIENKTKLDEWRKAIEEGTDEWVKSPFSGRKIRTTTALNIIDEYIKKLKEFKEEARDLARVETTEAIAAKATAAAKAAAAAAAADAAAAAARAKAAAAAGDPEKIKVIAKDLSVFTEQVKSTLADLEHAYKEGGISVKDYYDLKRELVETVIWTEIAALENLLVQTEDEAKKNETVNKIIAKQIQLKREVTNLDRQEEKALSDLNKTREETLKLLDEIKARGDLVGEDEFAQRLAALKSQQDAEKDQLIAGLKEEVDQVKAIKQAQYTWEKEQAQLLADYEKEKREEVLNSMAANFGRVADLFNTFYSQRLQTINNTEQAIENAENAGDAAKAARLKAQLESQKASARKQFNVAKVAAAAEAAINGALAITKAYAQEGIWGALGAITIAAAVGAEIANILSQSPGFEKGGTVEGQSGIDKVNIRATKREFVQPVSAVDYYGTGAMEAIRNKAIPKELLYGYKGMSPRIPSGGGYQTGGLVDSASPSADGREIGLQINNIVDPNLMGQYLTSRPGQKVILNVIGQNAFQIKRKLQV